jgi:hypothetical protein
MTTKNKIFKSINKIARFEAASNDEHRKLETMLEELFGEEKATEFLTNDVFIDATTQGGKLTEKEFEYILRELGINA